MLNFALHFAHLCIILQNYFVSSYACTFVRGKLQLEKNYLILQASLVTKLEDIISIVSILKAIESLKFLLRTIYILLKIVKIGIVEKNRIFL